MGKQIETGDAMTGLPKEKNKLTVLKANPLLDLWKSDLTLPEFKILDTYLARINPHKPELREVVFERKELEEIMGVEKINISVLRERLRHLLGKIASADSGDEENWELYDVTLFEEARIIGKQNNVKHVAIKCTESAMRYIFNIENIGYLRYKLNSIISLTSRHSYILFLYIEKNRYRKSWEINIDELKEMLSCENIKSYERYKEFNRAVLQKARKEITEKTTCDYNYEAIKNGREITGIRFTVETLNNISTAKEQLGLTEVLEGMHPKENIRALITNITDDECDSLYNLLQDVPQEIMPYAADDDTRRLEYLKSVLERVLRANAKKKINDQPAYLMKCINKDITEAKKKREQKSKKPKFVPTEF